MLIIHKMSVLGFPEELNFQSLKSMYPSRKMEYRKAPMNAQTFNTAGQDIQLVLSKMENSFYDPIRYVAILLLITMILQEEPRRQRTGLQEQMVHLYYDVHIHFFALSCKTYKRATHRNYR